MLTPNITANAITRPARVTNGLRWVTAAPPAGSSESRGEEQPSDPLIRVRLIVARPGGLGNARRVTARYRGTHRLRIDQLGGLMSDTRYADRPVRVGVQ